MQYININIIKLIIKGFIIYIRIYVIIDCIGRRILCYFNANEIVNKYKLKP